MSAAAPLQNTAAKPQPLSSSTHAGLLLQRKCACGSPAASLIGECEECESKKRLQFKLRIGASKDLLEHEADSVADQVLAAPTNPAVRGSPPHIQRFSPQATEGLYTAPASVDRVLASSGKALDSKLRQDMERRFNYDFSRVRVHSGSAAAHSAWEVDAHAYTAGHNIVFGANRYAPETNGGRRLIAHELTHVVQQDRGAPVVQRWSPCSAARLSGEECPARESDEIQRARSDAMPFLGQMSDPETGLTGSLIANFDIGKSTIKNSLKRDLYWKEFIKRSAKDGWRWKIIGFSDCHEDAGDGAALRKDRAAAVFNILPKAVQAQMDSYEAAPARDCMRPNGNLAERALNRSVAFVLQVSVADFSEDEAEDIVVKLYDPQEALRECQAGARVKTFPFRTTRFGGAPIMAHRKGDLIVVKMPVHVWSNSDFRKETNTLPSDTFIHGTELRKDEVVRVRHYEVPHWYNLNITGNASDDDKTDYCVTGEQMLKFAEATNKAFLVNLATTGVEAVTLGTPVGKWVGAGVSKVAAPVMKFGQQATVATALALREVAPTALAGTASRTTTTLIEEKAVQQVVARAVAPAVEPVAEAVVPRAVTSTAAPQIAGTSANTVLSSGAATGMAKIAGDVVKGRFAGGEVFEELSNELGMLPVSTSRSGGVASAVADAERAGLIGRQGAPGTVDMAFQPHGTASKVRGAYGITGQQGQSAHVGPTSFLKSVSGYSRSQAQTVILDPATHRAFDASWKAWAIAQRQAGETTCTVLNLRLAMHRAIEQIPNMSAQTRNTLAWRLEMEINELGLADSAMIPLPYPNIPRVTP